jgi:beta-phosphoglucomutase
LLRLLETISTATPHVILFAVNTSDGQIAMIFDLDGVLIHSMPLHVRAWEQYLEDLGIQIDDLEARMHGKRNPELVRDFIGADLADDAIFEHGAAKERLFREMVLRDELSRHQVPGLIDFLNRHKTIPKAIGSNAEPANIEFVLDRFNLRPYFDVIVDGQQVSRPKPFPDIYLKAAERLEKSPEHCIVFEDSPTGVEAARAAGMRVVGVETTPTEFAHVDLCVENFLDERLDSWLALQIEKAYLAGL